MAIPLYRRAFLNTLAAGLTGTLLSGCHSAAPSRSRSSKLTIIDTHTHFYDPTRPQGVSWPPREDTVLYRTVQPKDYLALPVPQPVAGTVVVEASPWVEDNQWVLDLAEREPFIVGFVGNLPVGTQQFAGHWKRLTANTLFRGIRLRGVNLAEAIRDPAVMSDLKRVAAQGRSVDLVGNPALLAPALRLATELSDLRFVIDHLAGVRIDGQEPPTDWRRDMRALAQRPNVYCKVSGLVEGTGHRGGQAPQDTEFYQPILDTMWQLYGPDRLIYGSNWPVCEHFALLSTVQRIVSEYFQTKGRPAEENVFWRNAKTVYQWVERTAKA